MGLFKKKRTADSGPADAPGANATGGSAANTASTISSTISGGGRAGSRAATGGDVGTDAWSRKASAGDIATLRAQLADLRNRLDASEQAKAEVEARLAALDATTTAIASNRLGGDDLRSRLDQIEGQLQGVASTAAAAASTAEAAAQKATAVANMPHPTTDPVLAARVDSVVARLDSMVMPAALDPQLVARLDALAARVEAADALGAQISELQQRLDQLQHTKASAEASSLTDGLAAQLAQLAERVSANDIAARHAAEQVAGLDQRLAAVSTELANQLRELGNDIDGLAEHQQGTGPGEVSDEVLDALRSGQVKLAAEQARYEIAFRSDLAALAEQVRRTAG